MTTLICEECGKIYHLDPEKLKEKLAGDEARTRCRECGHVMRITREQLEATPEKPAEPVIAAEPEKTAPPPAPKKEQKKKKEEKKMEKKGQRQGLGLRTKMFFLFLFVPLLLMTASGLFSQNQLNELSNRITGESTRVVQGMAEEIIAEKARSVGLQANIFLRSHPELGRMDFNYDPEFSRIAVQRVAESGYTVLFERPGIDETDQAFRIWAHPDARLIGIPIIGALEQALGPQYFPEFRRIIEVAARGREARGYYTWVERDGQLRQKFAVISPVEGTRYHVMATAYIDDFTEPVRVLENEARSMALHTRNITFGILIFSLFIIGLSISIYGYRITRSIKYLTDAADRISVGELDMQIDVRSKDEIGNLADAISRMQDSLKLSIERLRRRR
ncbi:HAMP domain-containing protein [Desulfobotulus alkaliphilus]|uniref:histidine kinase n=1 Tax=Desulfobotulus alkaliphilus TaxID=622671 RepID=A0A562S122_9BACT|nr:HAMP domain-containing protein [Desulfobotulus alkaliphilus]TWI74340.1 HAMP domain-containing protein [Desulfobotulus alkaliphilus]